MEDEKQYSPDKEPNDFAAEAYVLGSLLLNDDRVNHALRALVPDDFHSHANKIIFKVMGEFASSRKHINITSMREHLEKEDKLKSIGGTDHLLTLQEVASGTLDFRRGLERIKNASVLRSVIKLAKELISGCNAAEGASIERTLVTAKRDLIFLIAEFKYLKRSSGKYQHISVPLKKVMDDLHEKYEVQQELLAIAKKTKSMDPSNAK